MHESLLWTFDKNDFIYLNRVYHIRGSPALDGTVTTHSTEKIGIVTLRRVKYSSRKYYITLEPDVVHAYGLMPGDLLKIHLVEVRKEREHAEEPRKEDERTQRRLDL